MLSVDEGENTNVGPLTIDSVTPVPTGHTYCINEYRALGGRDIEDDEMFKRRIQNIGNIAARGTIAYLTQTFQKLNSDVLSLHYQGVNASSQPVIAIATQNGIDLSAAELTSLKDRAEEYLSLTELSPIGGAPNIELRNIEYQTIDLSFRCQLEGSANADRVRQELQLAISEYFDFRTWVRGTKVEWDDLLQIVKNHPSVQYVPDENFTPNSDIIGDVTKFPRVRGFLMMDLDGNIMENLTGTMAPVFYPANPDFSFNSTILATI